MMPVYYHSIIDCDWLKFRNMNVTLRDSPLRPSSCKTENKYLLQAWCISWLKRIIRCTGMNVFPSHYQGYGVCWLPTLLCFAAK